MSAQHTPGPWRVNDHHVYRDGAHVATCTPQWPGRHWTETAANARLIAAAPELLWELKRAANELDSLASFILGQSPGVADNALTTAGLARAAIAKAEGQ